MMPAPGEKSETAKLMEMVQKVVDSSQSASPRKVLDARGPGATAARRQPFWACFTRVRRRLRASPGAQRLET